MICYPDVRVPYPRPEPSKKGTKEGTVSSGSHVAACFSYEGMVTHQDSYSICTDIFQNRISIGIEKAREILVV